MRIDEIAHPANHLVVDAQQNSVQVVGGFGLQDLLKFFGCLNQTVGRLTRTRREEYHNLILNVQILKHFGSLVVVARRRKEIGYVLPETDSRHSHGHQRNADCQKTVEQHFAVFEKVIETYEYFAHCLCAHILTCV